MPRLRNSSRICGTAAAASSRSTVIRTSSEPARANAATCSTVPATSAVSVLVIDCTTIGAPPPTAILPTMTWVVLCRAWGPATSSEGGLMGLFMRSQISGFCDIHQGGGIAPRQRIFYKLFQYLISAVPAWRSHPARARLTGILDGNHGIQRATLRERSPFHQI